MNRPCLETGIGTAEIRGNLKLPFTNVRYSERMQLALRRIGPLAIQLALTLLALAAVAFAPPAQGRMLLVPIDGRPVSEVTIAEMRATPLRRGPLPGSWVVDGERRRLAGLWAQHVLVLAAPAALCSSE